MSYQCNREKKRGKQYSPSLLRGQ